MSSKEPVRRRLDGAKRHGRSALIEGAHNQYERHHFTATIQRARHDPKSLTASEVRHLQRTVGNQAVGHLLAVTNAHQDHPWDVGYSRGVIQRLIGPAAKIGSTVTKKGDDSVYTIRQANPPGHKGKKGWSYRLNPGRLFVKENDGNYELSPTQTAGPPGGPTTARETITLYHLTTAPKWAKWLAELKADTKHFAENKPIDPEITKKKRKPGEEYGDARGGDDLGPGFYTADSAEFVNEYYRLNQTPPQDTGVVKFVLPKEAIAKLRVRHIAPDDVDTFQQYMRDGFVTYDKNKNLLHLPKLDTQPPEFDVISGPINDAEAMKGKVPPTDKEGIQHSYGQILQLGDKVPIQWNWATDEGVTALYDGAEKIEYTPWETWVKESGAGV